jgi:hypothetical protein
LSVAQFANEQQRAAIADNFATASQGKLPIRATASEVVLMDNRSGIGGLEPSPPYNDGKDSETKNPEGLSTGVLAAPGHNAISGFAEV